MLDGDDDKTRRQNTALIKKEPEAVDEELIEKLKNIKTSCTLKDLK